MALSEQSGSAMDKSDSTILEIISSSNLVHETESNKPGVEVETHHRPTYVLFYLRGYMEYAIVP